MKNIQSKFRKTPAQFEEITINLDAPPAERWSFAKAYTHEINELIDCYWQDIEAYVDVIQDYLEAYKTAYISASYQEEIRCLSQYCKFDKNQLLIVNLYYDVIKFGFACTAFAFEQNNTIWHARNLDWWTENKLLAKHTKIFNWKSNGATVFKSVGWMGFIGVLSGMKPKAFSITLNAIVSEETPNFAKPVSFLLREILEEKNDFATAKEKLENTPIVCDCLLLLAGTKKSEIVVIERTPTKSKTRHADQNFIIVTNDYKTEIVNETHNENLLTATSCGRYDKTKKLLTQQLPKDAPSCFKILDDKEVKMEITVQQMVFNAAENKILLKKV